MKEQTKFRLKRIGSIAFKVVTYGLAAFGLVCAIAMASGGCAPKDRNAEVSSVKKVMPKEAPVATDGGNLLNAPRSVAVYGLNPTYFDYNEHWQTRYYRIDADCLYYLSWNGERPTNFAIFSMNNVGVVHVDSVAEHHDNQTESNGISLFTSWTWEKGGVYVSSLNLTYDHVVISYGSDVFPTLTLVDMAYAEPSNTFTLPDNWNPYQLRGGTPNEYGYGTYSENGTPTTFYDGFVFRSAGYLWNAIGFEVIDMHNNYVGYYDVAGVLRYHLITEENQQLINRVSFGQHSPIPLTWNGGTPTTNWVMTCPKVWVPELENPRSEGVLGAWVYLPKEPHQWSDPAFRTIEVLDVTTETWQASTQTAPAPTLEWLRRTFADETTFDPNQWVEGTYSPFTLIGNAFGSVVSLFSVMVLPGITLGVLIILPLVAGIIVLIIKAVSK